MTNNAPKRAKSTEVQLQRDYIVPSREEFQCVRAYYRYDYNKRCKSQQFNLLETTTAKLDHPGFNVGSLSPLFDKIKLPLQLYLESSLQDPLGHPTREHYNHQLITYLMIEPDSGVAPPCFQAWWLDPTPASNHPVPKLELGPWFLLTKIERRCYPNILRCCSSSLLISSIVTGMRLSTLRWTSRMLHSNNFTSLMKRPSHGGIFHLHMLIKLLKEKKRCAQARCGFLTLHCSAFAVQNTTLWEKIGQSTINLQILWSRCLQCMRMWTRKLEHSHRVGRSWNFDFPRIKIQAYNQIEDQT